MPAKGVPADANRNVKFWYECENWFPIGDPANNEPAVHPMAFPTASAVTKPLGVNGPANIGLPDPDLPDPAPAPAPWATIHLKQGGADVTPRSNEGLDIAWDDVG